MCLSPDPVSAHLTTVGGNSIEKTDGRNALKYAIAYNDVLDVEAVLADGTVVHLSVDDTGPDLLGVVSGSEGTLGPVEFDGAQRLVGGSSGELFDADQPVAHGVAMTEQSLAGFGYRSRWRNTRPGFVTTCHALRRQC
jgi:hypothetical protein